jgi:hypothetical protein
MKTIARLASILVLLIFYNTISTSLLAQEKRLEFNIGSGPPLDALHAGINFRITTQFDVGAHIGILPDGLDFNNHTNIGFETKYKFGESRTIRERVEVGDRIKRVKIKTWYGGLRLNLVSDIRKELTKKKYIYVTPAIGRHFNFNKTMGINIDFGLSLTANQSTTYSGNKICRRCFFEKHPQYPLLPSLRIQFFIKV